MRGESLDSMVLRASLSHSHESRVGLRGSVSSRLTVLGPVSVVGPEVLSRFVRMAHRRGHTVVEQEPGAKAASDVREDPVGDVLVGLE